MKDNNKKRTHSDDNEEDPMLKKPKITTEFINKLTAKKPTLPKPISKTVLDKARKSKLEHALPFKAHLASLLPFPTDHNFVSPSSLFNYVKQDPCQDVLKRFSWFFLKKLNYTNKLPIDATSLFIMDKGNEFELMVKDIFINEFKFKTAEIPKRGDDIKDSVLYQLTTRAMEEGYDMIYQACVFNSDLGVYGHPDFLIRSDLVNQISPNTKYPDEDICKYSRLGAYHYVVFDTKYRTLQLTYDNEKMINNDAEKYYKVQLYIYSKCMEYIQGCLPSYAYIIGRGYKSERKISGVTIKDGSNNIFERLGQVNILNIDIETNKNAETIPQIVDAGVKWIRTLRSIDKNKLMSVNWSNPDEDYFRPNMQNKYTSDYKVRNLYDIKKQIAVMQGEPTLLSNIGNIQRKLLHQQGIKSIYDPRCTTDAMGFNNGIIKTNLDIRLMQFRDTQGLIPDVYCRYISNSKLNPSQTLGNRDLIIHLKNNGYMVMDCESRISISDKFDDLPESDNNSSVYLIGIINVDKYGSSEFNPFVTNDLSDKAELENFKNFLGYMASQYQNNNKPKILVWSGAESKFVKNLLKKHDHNLTTDEKQLSYTILNNMIDMMKFFENESIIIKNSYTLSLKDVARRLYEMGLISTIWSDEMHNLLNKIDIINDDAYVVGITIPEHPDFALILKYNEIDCQVIVEIVDWLNTKVKQY
jgi:hypothetical protein